MTRLGAASIRGWIAAGLLCALSACGFVDSGGSQGVPVEAGPDRQVNEQTRVVLDASEFVDISQAETFHWTQLRGIPVELINADTEKASFIAPTVVGNPEVLVFSITVTDEFGAANSDRVQITVLPVNEKPTAFAGADKTVIEQTVVTITGRGTDPDGTISAFQWTQQRGTLVALTGANTDTVTFTAPTRLVSQGQETLVFRLTVTDNEGATASDAVSVIVSPVNAPPIANAGADRLAQAGQQVVLDGTGSLDSDGSIAAFEWVQVVGPGDPVVVLENPNTPTPVFTAPATFFGAVLTFSLTVTDNEGASSTDTVNVTVFGTLFGSASAGKSPDGRGGECWTTPQERPVTASLSADDKLAASKTYTLVQDATKGFVLLEPAGQFTYTPHMPGERGRDTFTYRVEDSAGRSTIRTATIIIHPKVMPLGDFITAGMTDLAAQQPDPSVRVGYRQPLFNQLLEQGYRIDFVGSRRIGANHAGFDPDVEAHGGYTDREIAYGRIMDGSDGIFAWLNRSPADVVLLHVGSFGLDTNADDIQALLDEIDRWEASAEGNPVTVVLARIIDRQPPTASEDVTTFNVNVAAMAQARVANGDDIVMIDQQRALWNDRGVPDPDLYGDRLHPNQAGYQEMASAWRQALLEHDLLDKCP